MKNTIELVQELFKSMDSRVFLFPKFNEKVVSELNDYCVKGVFSKEEKAVIDEFVEKTSQLVTAISSITRFGIDTDLEPFKKGIIPYEKKILLVLNSKVSKVA